jgi:hypothetical protein
MNRASRLVKAIHGYLLRLYPWPFRAEYGDELRVVFGLAVDDAARKGTFPFVRTGLRELRDLPRVAIREHLRERQRRKGDASFGGVFDFSPGSWHEGLAAALPFLLVGALAPLIGSLHPVFPRWMELCLALGLIFLPLVFFFLLGLIKGLPRWFLPYAGLAGSLFLLVVGMQPMHGFFSAVLYRRDPWLVRAVINAAIPGFGLWGLATLAVLSCAVLRPLRQLLSRTQRDGSLVSFALYGAVLPTLLLNFDEYAGSEHYIAFASLSAATGAWAYLHVRRPRGRVLTLFAGISVSMAVAAVGKAMVYSSLDWRFRLASSWQIELLSTVLDWVWLMIVVITPSLLWLLSGPADYAHGKTADVAS